MDRFCTRTGKMTDLQVKEQKKIVRFKSFGPLLKFGPPLSIRGLPAPLSISGGPFGSATAAERYIICERPLTLKCRTVCISKNSGVHTKLTTQCTRGVARGRLRKAYDPGRRVEGDAKWPVKRAPGAKISGHGQRGPSRSEFEQRKVIKYLRGSQFECLPRAPETIYASAPIRNESAAKKIHTHTHIVYIIIIVHRISKHNIHMYPYT